MTVKFEQAFVKNHRLNPSIDMEIRTITSISEYVLVQIFYTKTSSSWNSLRDRSRILPSKSNSPAIVLLHKIRTEV